MVGIEAAKAFELITSYLYGEAQNCATRSFKEEVRYNYETKMATKLKGQTVTKD
jgi:hypothetical protein